MDYNDQHVTPPVMDPEDNLPQEMDIADEMPKPSANPQVVNAYWLQLSRDAWQSSQTWFDSSMRVALERAYANFRGVHPPGSKYHSENYEKKSRLFRPKTRSTIRRTEAAAAVAFFSTNDVVHCSPENESDPRHVLAAEVKNILINIRLNKPKSYWYLTLLGACQDAATTGVVISKQYWEYEISEQKYRYEYDDGEVEEGSETRVMKDRPRIELLPVENFRFSSAADWTDPVNSSPYTIEICPTYVYQIKERSESGEYYKDIGNGIIGAAIHQDWDSIRQAREGGQRIDKYDNPSAITDFQIVWVYRHIIRIGGQDWCYDTLGQEFLLQEPLPIEAVYPHCETGKRPYRMGSAILDAHKNYPGGLAQLIEDLQEESNDLANLRLDALKHWINPHWVVRRGRGVDVQSLVRNTPSGVTYSTDIEKDIRELQKQGFPAAAFEQENRLNLDIDDIVGNFSQSSIQANRQLNETVGGMSMLQGDANLLQEYTVRTIALTWAQPVLEQLVEMESVYETDDTILDMVASQLGRSREEIEDVLGETVAVNVNVGFGSTNPEKRIAKLALALSTMATYLPQEVQRADAAEIAKEVFGAVGYDDGTRFFPHLKRDAKQDPRVAQLEQQVQQLMQLVQGKQMEIEGRITVAQIAAEAKVAGDKIRQQTELYKLQAGGDEKRYQTLLQMKLDALDRAISAEKEDRERQKLWMEREALSQHILESNREWNLKVDQIARGVEIDGEGKQKPNGKDTGAKNMPGKDRAGIVTRDDYGAVVDSAM